MKQPGKEEPLKTILPQMRSNEREFRKRDRLQQELQDEGMSPLAESRKGLPCGILYSTLRNLPRLIGSWQTLLMAHFPQPHTRTRAPRVRIPADECIKFNLGKRKVSATLQRLSVTGGLARFHEDIGEQALAEIVLDTASGPVNALVELLKPLDSSSRPFRFVALDDSDFDRLVTTIQAMRQQGWGEHSR